VFIRNTPTSDFESRNVGKPFTPFLRVDISYQNVESDIDAYDLRAEAGYGPIAVYFNQTDLKERHPGDELNIIRTYGLFRKSFASLCELDVGIGVLSIDGNDENTGVTCTVPFLIYPLKYAGFEFRPAWSSVNGNSINDYDVALMLGKKFVSLKFGYRWLQSVHESLDGPYAGLSFHF
jgi:hypothetical protein